MRPVTAFEGPVAWIDGQLVLRIPLAIGAAQLVASLHGAGHLDDDFLTVVIAESLADDLRIAPGTIVSVDNRGGNFTIARCRNPAPRRMRQANDRASEWKRGTPHRAGLSVGALGVIFAAFDRAPI